MSPKEFWLEFDMHNETTRATTKGLGGLSTAEWDKARKLFKEKMNGRNS